MRHESRVALDIKDQLEQVLPAVANALGYFDVGNSGIFQQCVKAVA
jgi:hypothetical protein